MGSAAISSPAATRSFDVDDRRPDARSPFAPNSIYTTKYNLLTFLPKFAMEQFRKTSNCLFLLTSGLQQIEGLAPTNRYATSIGLCFVLSVSAVKEIWEDWRRSEADVRANRSVARVVGLRDRQMRRVTWAEVQVGDVIEVRSGEEAPADLVIVASSEPGGLCFVETSNIDGETNLKIRSALFKDTHVLYDVLDSIRAARMECEHPNSRIDGFEGVLRVRGGDRMPVGKEHVLIRGARLRNTAALVGVVVYTGAETKIMMNTNDRDVKVTRMESIYNQQTVLLFLLLLGAILYNFFADRWYELDIIPRHHYIVLNVDWGQWVDILYRFLVFCLLYHNFVPINLNITVESVRLLLGHGISNDEEFVAAADEDDADPEPCSELQPPPELPTVCRTSTLVEELGQVRFVFSDKTGTLTRNQMRLKHLAFCDQPCLDLKQPQYAGSADADTFFRMLAVCHTVVVDEQGKLQASSPDEAAIVKGLHKCPIGWQFVNRDLHHVYVRGPNGAHERFQLLNVLEFTSERRRMSVIVKDEAGVIWLYSKGADDVLFRNSLPHPYDAAVKAALDGFGRAGMRTLCFAYRQVDETEYLQWLARYNDARNSLADRAKLVEHTCDDIERAWKVIGVSAVEDRLQDRVPETIHMLREAGMSVWVLTGDRKETALNVGYSCGLIDPTTFVHHVEGEDLGEQLVAAAAATDRSHGKYCIIIEGAWLETVLTAETRQRFLAMAMSAEAVICCRTSPQQKAAIVRAVKEAGRGVTLAIGDGANDVSMIRAAHVGVGLCGREGVQAARSADFALRKFCHLQRLLLVHGCYSYQRLSKVFLYCLYKNLMLYAAQFWYSWRCGFSGQSLYDGWFLSLYNILFACVPIIVLGVTEQYVQPGKLLVYPGLYRTGPAGRFFNPRSYWATALNSIFQSLVIINVVLWAYGHGVVGSDNQPAGLWSMGATVFAVSVVTVNLKIFIIANYWTWLLVIISCAGPACWFVYTCVADYISALARQPMLIGGISKPLVRSPVFWSLILLVPVVCLSRDFLWKFYKRSYTPLGYHIIQELEEIERKSLTKTRMREERERGAPPKDRSAVHGFAFSQTEGQDKILSLARPFLKDPFRLLMPSSIDWSQ